MHRLSLLTLSIVVPLIGVGLARPAHAHLDVVFLLDTTGSMSGEIREAKERVRQLSDALREARPEERIRIGVVAYRDRGDAYVTRQSPLAPDVATSSRFLAGLRANGGGDGPEDVISGLRVTLREMNWDFAPEVERQVFLIGDAPPHLDYGDNPETDTLIDEARERRIVVNTIGCRSLPKNGVEFFRRVAYATEGSYQHIGRVRAQDPGLAEAMLRTLTDEDRDDPGAIEAIGVRGIGRVEEVPTGGVLVRTRDPRDGVVCTVEVALPRGTGLRGEPSIGLGSRGLEVRLELTQGPGGRESFGLDRCIPTATPIRVSFGG